MTGKEALEKLINYYNNALGNYVMNNYSKEINLIKQDLERLEKYKEVIEIIDNALEIYVVDDKLGVKYQYCYIHYEDSKMVEEVLNNG